MNYWKDKTAIVTGGSSGFGLALSAALARNGANVVIASRSESHLQAAAEQMRDDGGSCLPIVADVTRQQDVNRLVEAAVDQFGRVDLLINGAGRSMRGAIAETTVEDFRELLEINFLAAVRCTRTALPHLRRTRGHIVHIGSLAAKVAARWLSAYPASKHPLAAYAQQLRLELASEGVHVLLVCPGPIANPNPDASESKRYRLQADGLPEAAARPGGGARLRALDPVRLADRVLEACRRRRCELVAPARARLLFAVSQVSPRVGDWLLKKMT